MRGRTHRAYPYNPEACQASYGELSGKTKAQLIEIVGQLQAVIEGAHEVLDDHEITRHNLQCGNEEPRMMLIGRIYAVFSLLRKIQPMSEESKT